jgi:hypothetical protein
LSRIRPHLTVAVMLTQSPKLQVLLENHPNQPLTLKEACKKEPLAVLESILASFVWLPVTQKTIRRIQLQHYFCCTLRSPRPTSPYGLGNVIQACKAGVHSEQTLEGKFWAHGGARAITALHAATSDNKKVATLLDSLEELELQSLFEIIDATEPHKDFCNIAAAAEADKKRPSHQGKRNTIFRPRPPRARWYAGGRSQPRSLQTSSEPSIEGEMTDLTGTYIKYWPKTDSDNRQRVAHH